MRFCSLISRNIIVVLLTIVPFICAFAMNIFAQEAVVKIAGISAQRASLGSSFPYPKTDSSAETEGTLKGDLLAAKTHYELGNVSLEKGDYDQAIVEFSYALQIYPMSAESYNNRGIAYSAKELHELAIRDFTKSIEIMPDSDKAYCNRGITYAIKRQSDLALLDFKKCIEHNHMNADAYNNRGGVFADLACLDWTTACQLGKCDFLNQAVRMGVCIPSGGNAPLPPQNNQY